MTEPQETPTELAKRLWDTAIEHLNAAAVQEDVGLSDAYCNIGQLALMAAQFALNNQGLLVGLEPGELPPDPTSLPTAVPGAPPIPVWGARS